MTTRAVRRLRILIAVDAALLVVVVLGLCWLALRVWDAGRALQDAAGAARGVPSAVAAGDFAGAGSALTTFAEASATAAEAAATPGWAIAESLPIIGADVTAVRVLAVHADELGRAASPAAALLTSDQGDLDAETIHALDAVATRTSASLMSASEALGDLDESGLTAIVGSAVAQFREAIDTALPATRTVQATAALLGSLAAADDTHVLVLLQNNAEARTGGGITGSFMLLSGTGLDLELTAQADSAVFAHRTSPIAAVPASMDALYGDVSARFVQNTSMAVDFAETARLAVAWWQSVGYAAPDAVLSIDPLVLRSVLAVTGPITLADGAELTADNLVQQLLVDPYLTADADGQTALLQTAAAAVFEHVTAIDADPVAWLAALAEPLAEGRISLWSADAGVQEVIADSAVGGPAARVAAAGADAFAVYFNDATGGKMDTFLAVSIASGVQVCRPDERSDIVVRVTMRSDAPADAAQTLPPDMTGNGLFGTAVGDIGTSVSVSAPPGTFFGGVTKDGAPALSVDVEDAGRPTSLVRVNLSPGETNVIDFHFVSANPGLLTPHVVHTPMINAITVEQLDAATLPPCA